ncbi:MAG: fibronectin type III domain-containing protein [Candidatus Aegiribacteria sp.]|nr:fibronectin type III domain-containing protein [Candidatus Aegiribacteria sp.]
MKSENSRALCIISVLLVMFSTAAYAGIQIDPTAQVEDLAITEILLEGVEYDRLELSSCEYRLESEAPGSPSMPYRQMFFMLPPGQMIDEIRIVNPVWETLDGKYLIEPAQAYLSSEYLFTPPDEAIYNSRNAYPSNPVLVIDQGSCMGFGVTSVRVFPVRFSPLSGEVQVLTGGICQVSFEVADFHLTFPQRITRDGQLSRNRFVKKLVCNSEDMARYGYSIPEASFDDGGPLNITMRPVMGSDPVKMVIITNEELLNYFEKLAKIRTKQGIVTVVRTVEWIENEGGYPGRDTQERIRNFVRDCYNYWDTEAVLLGGDDHVVPARRITKYPGHYRNIPEDEYYGDMSEYDWINSSTGEWKPPTSDLFFEVWVGRWPADNASDVSVLLSKLNSYEYSPPAGFGRRALFAASDSDNGFCPADDFYDIYTGILAAGHLNVGGSLDEIYQLYNPIHNHIPEWHGDDLMSKVNYLAELDSGYNILLHGDHSGIHNMGAGWHEKQLFESNLLALANYGAASIVWHVACLSGHFEDADCISEVAVLSDNNDNAFVAIVSSPRMQPYNSDVEYFMDGLYPYMTGSSIEMKYLGEAFTYAENCDYNTYVANLFGDPFMFVWRDDPDQLSVSTPLINQNAGTFNLSATVSCSGTPVRNALVCVYKEGEIYTEATTDLMGCVTFTDLTALAPGNLYVTAVKRDGSGNEVVNYIPDEAIVSIVQSTGVMLDLNDLAVDDGDEGELNPGETVYLDLTTLNTGLTGATNVDATLSCSDSRIAILDGNCSVGSVPAGFSVLSDNAFQIELEDNPANLDPVLLSVQHSCGWDDWTSEWVLDVYSGEVVMPVYELEAVHEAGNTQLSIHVDRIVMANTGRGNISNLTLTAENFYPVPGFIVTGDLSESITGIQGGSGIELTDPLLVRMVDIPVSNPWADPHLTGCTFDLTLTDAWGNMYQSVTVDLEGILSSSTPAAPTDLALHAATDSTLVMEWNASSATNEFFVRYRYTGSIGSWNMLQWSPVPTENAIIDQLDPAKEYVIRVTGIDELGRESDYVETSEVTCLEILASTQMNGTCAGPVVFDDCMYAVTSNGYFYRWDLSSNGLPTSTFYAEYSFTGCAAGDVDNDGDTDLVAGAISESVPGKVYVIIFENDGHGSMSLAYEIETSDPGQTLRECIGIPVLVQADNGYLEIALVTSTVFYSSPGTTWFHVWRYESDSDSWGELFTGGPQVFAYGNNHLSYTPPVSIGDFDSDGNQEMAVATNNSSAKPTLYIYDLVPSATCTSVQLTRDENYNVRTTLASAKHGGKTYVAGVLAWHQSGSDLEKRRLFLVDLSMHPFQVSLTPEESLSRFNYSDQFGGGPAFARINGDLIPDLVCCLSDRVKVWRLNLTEISSSPEMELDPIFMNFDQNITPTVVNGRLNSDICIGIGYSTRNYGFTASPSFHLIPGLPMYSMDQVFAAPLIGDYKGNSNLEMMIMDNSGQLRILDLDASPGSAEWPVLQHDNQRTGFFNFTVLDSGPDLSIYSIEQCENASIDIDNSVSFTVTVEVTGTDDNCQEAVLAESAMECCMICETAEASTVQRERAFDTAVSTFLVKAYVNNCEVASEQMILVDGYQDVIFSLPAHSAEGVVFVVDPDNRVAECDESNNSTETRTTTGTGVLSVSFENPVNGRITASITNTTPNLHVLTGALYSLDGRLVAKETIELQPNAVRMVELFDKDLPSGFYAIRLEYAGIQETIRLILLD